jgi:hypothetical protein
MAILTAAAIAAAPTIVKSVGNLLNQRDTKGYLKDAEKNLQDVQKQGVTSTLTPELQESMRLAMKQYQEANDRAKFGFSAPEKSAFINDVNRVQTGQLATASEAGGGQAARYMSAVGANNKSESLLDLMSKDATIRLQKQQQAQSAFSPVAATSGAIQNVKDADVTRYNTLLSSAGKAISDLRKQKAENRNTIFSDAADGLGNVGKTLLSGMGGGSSGEDDVFEGATKIE